MARYGAAGRELEYIARMKAMRTAGGEGPMMTVDPLSRAQVPMTERPVVMPMAPAQVIPSGPVVRKTVLPAHSENLVSMAPIARAVPPGLQGVSRAEFQAHIAQNESAFKQLSNLIGKLQSQIASLADSVQGQNTASSQALSIATQVGDSLQTLATNASKAMSTLSDQVDAQNQALIALARGATETFTPRRIVVPKVPPSKQRMPTTVDSSGRPVGVDGNLNAQQGTPGSRVAGYRR